MTSLLTGDATLLNPGGREGLLPTLCPELALPGWCPELSLMGYPGTVSGWLWGAITAKRHLLGGYWASRYTHPGRCTPRTVPLYASQDPTVGVQAQHPAVHGQPAHGHHCYVRAGMCSFNVPPDLLSVLNPGFTESHLADKRWDFCSKPLKWPTNSTSEVYFPKESRMLRPYEACSKRRCGL